MVIEPPHLQQDAEQQQQEQQPPRKVVVLNDGADDNDFDSMNIRPESLFLRGVDELSPRNIKLYIDGYIKPEYSFATKDRYESLNYKIEWINDSSLNIVFQDATLALTALAELSTVPVDQISNTEERRAKEYRQANELGEAEDKTAELYIRQSFSYDKKIKNARVYSRYYLLNGEPDKRDRPKREDYYNRYKKTYRERDPSSSRDEEPDLITGEVVNIHKEEPDLIPNYKPLQERIGVPNRNRNSNRNRNRNRTNRDEEEDLFPQFNNNRRSRSRSPIRTMDDVMDIDDSNNKSLDQRIQPVKNNGRSLNDLLGLK